MTSSDAQDQDESRESRYKVVTELALQTSLSLAKCSKLRDLIAIAICDSNCESQITSDLRQCEPSQKAHCSDLSLVVKEIGIAILLVI